MSDDGKQLALYVDLKIGQVLETPEDLVSVGQDLMDALRENGWAVQHVKVEMKSV